MFVSCHGKVCIYLRVCCVFDVKVSTSDSRKHISILLICFENVFDLLLFIGILRLDDFSYLFNGCLVIVLCIYGNIASCH